jgi:nucleotide-binding universal stress UspA family protein
VLVPIRDILLQMNSYPDRTPSWAIDAAVYLAERLGAKLSAGLCQVQIPDVSNYLSQLLVRSKDLIAAENQKSAENAIQLMLHFDETVGPDRLGDSVVIPCPGLVTPWQLAARARLYDLSIVPIYGHRETRSLVEGLAFESGRPVLLLPPEGQAGHRFDDIVIGWDGSRAAARALADALPICEVAASVTVVTVAGEKALPEGAPPADVIRHLSRHGISAEVAHLTAVEQDVGGALRSYCKQSGADLLVMGAYGHSRAREFVLGGATHSVLHKPSLPVLMSH